MPLVVECPACWNKRKHRVGCPVILLEAEAVRKALAQVVQGIDKQKAKLQPIALAPFTKLSTAQSG
jgi:hypothetical protein